MWLWSTCLPAHAGDKAILIPQDEWAKHVAQVAAMKQDLADANRKLSLYRQLKADHQRLITLDAEHIKELEAVIATHEEAGKSAQALLAACEAKSPPESHEWAWGMGGWATGAAMAAALVLWIVN